MTTDVTTRALSLFAEALQNLGMAAQNPVIAAAVSGGGDSLAMALLLHDWAAARGGRVIALTVDHKLRPGSSAEAERTGALLASRGIEHKILTWHGDKPATHIQERARQARYDLLVNECARQGCATLAVGHNLEDQIETFWMRLAHGSGLDGLSGMAAAREARGVNIIRPVLTFTRAELRAVCASYGVEWIEDPSNENGKFLRVRLRQFEDVLSAEGLSPPRLAQTVRKLEQAREALEFYAAQAFRDCVTLHDEGYATLDIAAWTACPADIRMRVLSAVLQAIYPQDYPAGFEALDALCADIASADFKGQTLAGCDIFPSKDAICICREAAVAEGRRTVADKIVWDRRFSIKGNAESLEVGALGEAGLRELGKKLTDMRRLDALPFKVKKGLPALWQGQNLVAIPHLGWRDAAHVDATAAGQIALVKIV